jgi:Ca2+-binding RTX toxin-like protein
MSEVTVVPGSSGLVTGPGYSLQIISEEPVRVKLPGSPGEVLEIFGTDSDDSVIVSSSTTVPVVFNAGDGFDYYDAGSGNDFLFGGEQDDFLAGGAGDDFIFGEEDDDILYGDAGNDVIRGNEGDDVIVGGAGNDDLRGGTGDDKIIGGPGNDILDGGRGQDVLIGGAGKDTFVVRPGTTGGDKLDKIKDFKPQDDIIKLKKGLLPGCKLEIGSLTAADFASVTEINDTVKEKLVYEEKSGILYYNPTKGVEVPLLQLPKDLTGLTSNNIQIF